MPSTQVLSAFPTEPWVVPVCICVVLKNYCLANRLLRDQALPVDVDAVSNRPTTTLAPPPTSTAPPMRPHPRWNWSTKCSCRKREPVAPPLHKNVRSDCIAHFGCAVQRRHSARFRSQNRRSTYKPIGQRFGAGGAPRCLQSNPPTVFDRTNDQQVPVRSNTSSAAPIFLQHKRITPTKAQIDKPVPVTHCAEARASNNNFTTRMCRLAAALNIGGQPQSGNRRVTNQRACVVSRSGKSRSMCARGFIIGDRYRATCRKSPFCAATCNGVSPSAS